MQLKGLTIQPDERENMIIFRLNGDIRTDIYTEFLNYFKEIAKKSNIIMDFTNVNYMSSSGAGALFNLDKVARENNKQFLIFSLAPSVKKIIELTKLYDKFCIFQTENEAISKIT